MNWFSDVSKPNRTIESELPPPLYDERIWLASCRPPHKLDVLEDDVLLYQPDCRLFCTKGAACKHAGGSIFFKQTQKNLDHMNAFIHAPKTVMLEVQLRLSQCNPPGEPARQTLGGTECWSLRHGRSEVSNRLSKRSIIVYVHGFKQRYNRIINVANNLNLLLSKLLPTDAADAPLILGFEWPSMSSPVQYMAAKDMASVVSVRLRWLIESLQAANCQIVIVAHSLGARVALGALVDPGGGWCRRIHHLVLLAPAVPSHALCEESGEFPRSRVAAENITICWSGKDRVLRDVYGIGERIHDVMAGSTAGAVQDEAMGAVGLAGDEPEGCTSLDFSYAIKKHAVTSYISVPDVVERIYRALPLSRESRVVDSLAFISQSIKSVQPFQESDSEDESPCEGQGSALETAMPSQKLHEEVVAQDVTQEAAAEDVAQDVKQP